MAHTHKTDLAYKAHKRSKELRDIPKADAFPGDYVAKSNANYEDIRRSGQRHGNNRKQIAAAKVTERRHERKRLNRNIDTEE